MRANPASFPASRVRLLFLGGALVMSVAALPAATVSITSVADNSLFERFPDNNMGGGPDIAAGTVAAGQRSRALFRFDVAAAVPAGATVTSVSLQLSVVKTPSFGGPASTFNLHRMLADWGEGSRTGLTGSAGLTGESTWNHRFRSATSWGSAGAEAGTDYTSAFSGGTLVSGVGSYTWSTTAGLVADVQAWLDAPAANFGWILISDAEGSAGSARRIGTRENASESFRPQLAVTYTEPAVPINITSIAVSGGLVTLQWTGGSTPYTIQNRRSVVDPWGDLVFPVSENNVTFQSTESIEFYRVASD